MRLPRRADVGAFFFAWLCITVAFCYYHSCWSFAAFGKPWYILYDIPLLSGYLKAASEGDAYPFQAHMISRLNAPFQANWSDFPTTEELLYLYGGLLTRALGIVAAYNVCILTAHWLAGLAFYVSARVLGGLPSWSALGAIAFASSRYMFVRDGIHINLTFYWHLPFYWVAAKFLWDERPLTRLSGGLLVLLAFVSSWLHPYYWYFWMVTLVPCLVGPLVRKNLRRALETLGLMGLSVFFLVLAQVDSFLGWAEAGKSGMAYARTLNELQLYSLRLPEFFLPADHHLRSFSQWAHIAYHKPMLGWGLEMDSSYLGLFALCGFVWMMGLAAVRVCQGKLPDFFAGMNLWLMLVALGGGLNMVLGSLGLMLFRCSCRFSILILAGTLLFLVLRLSARGGARWFWLVMLAALVVIDQTPPKLSDRHLQQTAKIVHNDQAMVDWLEAKLPKGAMVFQWPATPYPEAPMFLKLAHYEEMVAYLLSSQLHFSYGDCRGRPESKWQERMIGQEPEAILKEVEGYGFAAAIVYLKGLDEEETALWQKLARKPDWISPEADRWVYLLEPNPNPSKPELEPAYFLDRSFYDLEKDDNHSWRWASGPAKIDLLVPEPCPYKLKFGLVSYGQERTMTVKLDGQVVWSGPIVRGADQIAPVEVDLSKLKRGNHRVLLQPSGGLQPKIEGRLLVFQVVDLELQRIR